MHLVPVICFPLLCCLQSSWCRAVELAIEDERLVVFQSPLCLFAPNWSCQCRCFLFPLSLEVWSPFSKDFLNSKEDFFCSWSQKTWRIFALLFGLKTPQATPVPSKGCWEPLTPRQLMSHLKSFDEGMRNSVCPAHFCGLGMKTPLLNYIDAVKNFWQLLISGVYIQ